MAQHKIWHQRVLCVIGASVVWFYVDSTFAESPCRANSNFKAVVLERKDTPPALDLIFSAAPRGRCGSRVLDELAQRPSWELISKGKAVHVTVNNKQIITQLEPLQYGDLSQSLRDAVAELGLR
jgi:hypothetical protein